MNLSSFVTSRFSSLLPVKKLFVYIPKNVNPSKCSKKFSRNGNTWHQGKLHQKILFYLHPFLQDLVYIWSDMWSVNQLTAPVPAIVKLSLSVLILCVMLIPVVYCLIGTVMYLGFWQYQIESFYPGIIFTRFKVYRWFGIIFQQLSYSEDTVKQWKRQFYQGLLFVVGTIDYFRVMLELI